MRKTYKRMLAPVLCTVSRPFSNSCTFFIYSLVKVRGKPHYIVATTSIGAESKLQEQFFLKKCFQTIVVSLIFQIRLIFRMLCMDIYMTDQNRKTMLSCSLFFFLLVSFDVLYIKQSKSECLLNTS